MDEAKVLRLLDAASIDIVLAGEQHTAADRHRVIDHIAAAIGYVKEAKGELDAEFRCLASALCDVERGTIDCCLEAKHGN